MKLSKNRIFAVALLLAVMCCTLFVGCDVTTTVYFNPNYDGAEKITVEMGLGDKLTPPQVSRDGYYVEGWYLEKECTTPVNDFGLVWTGSEYFAKWNPNPVSLSATYDGVLFEGGTPSKDNVTVTVNYFDGSTAQVSDFEVDFGNVTDSAGTKTATVTYTEHGVTVNGEVTLNVAAVALQSIAATYTGKNIVVGGQLNHQDITVEATYTDGSTQTVTNFAVGAFSSAVAGTQTVEISYTEDNVTVSDTISVTVVEEGTMASGSLSIHFLELGNAYTGDSVYIKAGDTDILIDAGSRKDSASTISDYIDDYCTDGVLEYVVVTHAHQDHIAGFVGSSKDTGLFERYECETIIEFARTNATTAIYEDYCEKRNAEVAEGANCYTALECVNNENGAQKVYDLTGDGSVTMEILYQEFYENKASDENDYSVCVLITQGEHHYLLTGDLEEAGEQSLVENNPDLPEVVLYKGGHHGSYTAANEVLLSKIKPQYVCICCCAGTVEYMTQGTQNLHHTFPAQEFIDRVAPYTDCVYVTSLMHIKFDESKNKWVNDYVESMNGNIVFSCIDGVITLQCSNNDTKLKDTQWFKENRTCPDAWRE